ncbi:hypothetical protein [Methylobacterium planeticum]|uniref:Uncharacterized protein n=1 Tax=Methylobacterium planeticum TaxID=2615211 RepID=A0A6N6MW75_9HYPH|nr:hypothetical protein [Methylobacterium planeticum]KAB1074863.1 hypothetical protein F6X51_07015 [Methylobacterium planeticum]
MSEPARHYPPQESGSRTSPGPLRDWLAAMKAHAPVAPDAKAPRADAPRAADPGQAWAPRVVQAAEAAVAGAEAEDVSELMAENLMLKAKLRQETDRYAELQAILAQEIRDLRKHVQDEMSDLQAIREERDLWQARCEALAQPLFQKR